MDDADDASPAMESATENTYVPLNHTVWGSVAKTGSISGGHGFRVEKKDVLVYVIKFDPPYRNYKDQLPAVVATQNNNNRDGPPWQTPTDGIVVQVVSLSQFTVVTGDYKGYREDRGFGFIAVGYAR